MENSALVVVAQLLLIATVIQSRSCDRSSTSGVAYQPVGWPQKARNPPSSWRKYQDELGQDFSANRLLLKIQAANRVTESDLDYTNKHGTTRTTTAGHRKSVIKRRALPFGHDEETEEPGGFIEVSPEVQTHLSHRDHSQLRLQAGKSDLFSPKASSTTRPASKLMVVNSDHNQASEPSASDGQLSNIDPSNENEDPQVGQAASEDQGDVNNGRNVDSREIDHLQAMDSVRSRMAQQQQQKPPRPKLMEMSGTSHAPGGAIYSGLTGASSAIPRAAPFVPGSSTRAQQALIQTNNNDYINRLYLDSSTPLEVQAHVGSTAYLVCRLRSIQQQDHLQVSWVRNMQILTSGELRYTSDERFRPTHVAGTHDWALEIHQVNANDEGEYECQVNSEPKAASVSLYLDVIAASIEILEQSPLVVEKDGEIKLTCRVEFNSQINDHDDEGQQQAQPMMRADDDEVGKTDLPKDSNANVHVEQLGGKQLGATSKINRVSAALSSQHYIYWYKDNVDLLHNNPRGGIKVERRESPSSLDSVLTLNEAVKADSGVYMCKILPELNEVAPAECQVLVGGLQAASSGSISGCWSRQSSSIGLIIGTIWWTLLTFWVLLTGL